MKLTHTLTLILLSLMLIGCGGDYEANPIVTTEGNETIIVDGSTVIDTTVSDAYIQDQLTELQENLWQSGCYNNTIVELEMTATDRVMTTYLYNDTNCSELFSTTALVSNASYSIYELVTDSSGFNMIRIEFRTALTNSTTITRTTFAIVQNRLYFGIPANSGLTYPTDLNFANPFYQISDAERIEIPAVDPVCTEGC